MSGPKTCECGNPTYADKCSLCLADETLFAAPPKVLLDQVVRDRGELQGKLDAALEKLKALEKQEPVALLAQGISKGVIGAEKLYFPQERQAAIEFCTAAHEKGGYPVTEIRPLYAAAGAAPKEPK